MASILALGTVLGGVMGLLGSIPAVHAHVCTKSVEVLVDRQFSVNIGVAAEDKPVRAVEITVPDGFDLDEPFGYLGWTGERRGDVVHFSGGAIRPYQCGFFTFKGSAPKKGVYVAEIVTVDESGKRVRYDDPNPYSAFPAMSLFAGTPMPPPDEFDGTSDDGPGPWRAFAIAVAAGLLVVGIAWRVRSR